MWMLAPEAAHYDLTDQAIIPPSVLLEVIDLVPPP
jgi:hypothetical protein